MTICLTCMLTLLLSPATANAEETPVDKASQENDVNAASSENAEEASQTPSTEMTVQRPPPPVLEEQQHIDLKNYLRQYQREQEMVDLLAEGTAFYGLYLVERSGSPQGGVLLLPDIEQHAQWPEIIAPLREYLPDYGWNTLAITLPDAPYQKNSGINPPPDPPKEPANKQEETDNGKVNKAPETMTLQQEPDNNTGERAENDSQDSDHEAGTSEEPALPKLKKLPEITREEKVAAVKTEPEKTPEQKYTASLSARISSAMQYLNDRGQFNRVIIAYGNSVIWAIQFIQRAQRMREEKEESSKGFYLVIINPRQDTLNQRQLNNELSTLDIPVLDVITSQNRLSAFHIKQRAGLMRHKKREHYQQVFLTTPDLKRQQHQMLKRTVRGWLKSNAAGVDLAEYK